MDIPGTLEALERRLRAILPEEYQDTYDSIQPVSMGSAGLKYGADGLVAWHEMWETFCDLAMAGGPPHKGTLLEPGSHADIDAQPDRYQDVVDEIRRGVTMVTDLRAARSPLPGWVRVTCFSEGMADWLVRAVVMENVAARRDGQCLDLPAAPGFRLEKEIKNVVTVMAKTCHYWVGHVSRAQQRTIASLFTEMDAAAPLVTPAYWGDHAQTDSDRRLVDGMAETIQRATGLPPSPHRYAGWLGVECPSVRAAIWMMRGLVVSNVLSRREGTTLFVPIHPRRDPAGDVVIRCTVRMYGFAAARGVL